MGLGIPESMAIGCALCWSITLIIFRTMTHRIDAVALNLFKASASFLLIVPTSYFVTKNWWNSTEIGDLSLLLVSGFIGIGVADSLLLKAVNLLNASWVALLETLYPIYMILIAVLFLGESLSILQYFGSILILGAVVIVVYHRNMAEIPQGVLWRGILYAAISLFIMAVGIAMVTPIYSRLPLIWIIEVRLAGGVLGALIFLGVGPQSSIRFRRLLSRENFWGVVIGSVLSTYFGNILWVAGYKYNGASKSAILNQTSTFMTLLLATLILKERLGLAKILGTITAVIGVLCITLG